MSSSPASKRRAVMDASNQTEEERRQLRRKQRRLNEEIVSDHHIDPELEFLSKAQEQNNELFDSVYYTREAVLDAENVDIIAQKYVQHADRMVQVPRYDPSRLINKLKQKCTASRGGSTFFDWKSLGYETGICFNAIPSRVSFLCGCLDSEKAQKERKERAARQRIAPDNAVEVRPDEVGGENNKGNADNLSAAEKLIKKVAKTLVKRSTEEHKKLAGKTSNEKDLEQYGPEIDGVRFLLDPLSFTHTVENIFAYSFLIKKGEAKVGVRSSMEATGIKRAGLYCGTMPSGDTEYPEATQAVISFTLNDWRRLCERWQEGDLPSRERNQQAKNSQTTQSQ